MFQKLPVLDGESSELIYCNGMDHNVGINTCRGCPDWLYLVKLWRTGHFVLHESEESKQEIKITLFKIMAF